MKYITGISICLAAVVGTALAGCSDALLADEPEVVDGTDVKSVAFTATVATQGDVASRGASVAEEDLLEPLVLADDGDDSPYELFLHTYTRPMDYRPEEAEPESRGMQVNSEKDLADIHTSFNVRADREADGSAYFAMQNTRMSSTTSYRLWTTEQPQRWPGEERLTFNAVAPHNHLDKLSGAVFGKNSISFSYTALKGNGDNDAEAQTDLLMATATMKRTETAEFNYRVPLHFNHALSAIKFAVRDVLKGRVVKISIKGVAGSADCVYTADDRSENGNFAWTNHRDTKDYGQIFNHEINDGNFDPTDEDHDVVLTDNMPEKTFMLIPQVIPDDATIEVTVERDNVADGLQRSITVRGKIRANNVTEWLPGHEYVYTISTSKDNWVYVFDAEGNAEGGLENIYVNSPSNERFDILGNNAYFNVKSYRYKANNPAHIEALPWQASHGGSLSYWVNGASETPYPIANPDIKNVTAEEWIQDEANLRGPGTATTSAKERHNLVFLPHYLSTTWKGDETMQAYEPYAGFDQDNPYDLSTFGGKIARTTANCYVIDRGGWYMFPIVYGNAIKNGATNTSAYVCQDRRTTADLKLLPTLYKDDNTAITEPYVSVGNNARAELAWQDAYDMISNVELVTINGERMIRFFVERNNLQQGNAVIALMTQSGIVRWSWHIWATEHWIDKDTRLPHVFDTGNSTFNTFRANAVTGMRECGDVEITYNQKGRSFMMSPYNVGYCDPKSVLYLKRKNNMQFVQYMPDGSTVTGLQDNLPIIQDGTTIEYKFANNTYYQWGRKDPMRGYFNHEHDTKRVFGSMQPKLTYMEEIGRVTIGRSIRNPHEFYVSKSGIAGSPYEDWLTSNFRANLWNNSANSSLEIANDDEDHQDIWSHTKTVYDPCPAGYMIPNAGVWHVVQKGWAGQGVYSFPDGTRGNKGGTKIINGESYTASARDTWSGGNWLYSAFVNKANGARLNNDLFSYAVWGKGNANKMEEAVFFSSTGNRWWTDGWKPNDIGAGGNFGRNVSYAWSCRAYEDGTSYNAYGMAIGLDTDAVDMNSDETNQAKYLYYVGGQFVGRRAMGRPVRAIREP